MESWSIQARGKMDEWKRMKSHGGTTRMESKQPELARLEIMPACARPDPMRFIALAASRLKVLWSSVIWRSLVSHARSQRKTLSVRETAALGDRRFVSVIQFERLRFLIGSSPSS